MGKRNEKSGFMEDAEIFELYARDKLAANEKIVEKYSNYIYFFLHRNYPSYQKMFDELFQQGVIGILNALKNYDASKGSFMTYCTPFIKSECNRFFRFVQGEPSEHYFSLNQKVSKICENLEENGVMATPEMVAAKIRIGVKTAEREMKINYRTESLDAVAERKGEDPYMVADDRHVCKVLLSKIPENQRKIVFMRVVEELSFNKIAAAMGEKEYVIRKEYYAGISRMRTEAEGKKTKTKKV